MSNIIEQAEELKKQFENTRQYYKDKGWFTLYHCDYRPDGYIDQYGFGHWASVIDFEVEVKFKEDFVTESWGTTMQGIVVEDKDGNEYFRSTDATSMSQSWSGNGHFGLTTYFHGLTLREDGTRMDTPQPTERGED